MAWKMTARAEAIVVRTTYRCDECQYVFKVVRVSADEPEPECPMCAVKAAYVPPMPALLTNKSAAIDMAYKIAETDFGMTDMQDNQRAGDIAAKAPPPMQTAEREQLIQTLKEVSEQMVGAPIAPEIAAAQAAIGGAGFWTGEQMPSTGAVAGAGESTDAMGLQVAAPLDGVFQQAQGAAANRLSYQVMGADDMPAS